MNKITAFCKRLRFEFHLDIYLIRVTTQIMSDAYERNTFEICRLRVEVLRKKVLEFDLYKVPEWRRG